MRIQILPLPAVVVGDVVDEPFALVVDQCPAEVVSEFFAGQVNSFAEECGAKASLITSETVEMVDPHAEPAPGEPSEIATLPAEVRHLVHAVDRLRDDWAEADADHRHNLWANVHAANERVWNRFEGQG